jgi:hypothetical protein
MEMFFLLGEGLLTFHLSFSTSSRSLNISLTMKINIFGSHVSRVLAIVCVAGARRNGNAEEGNYFTDD